MLINTGLEDDNGCFSTRVVGESKPGETAEQAILRIAARFLNRPIEKTKHHWHPSWTPTSTGVLPALFVERGHSTRLFSVEIVWNAETKQYDIKE